MRKDGRRDRQVNRKIHLEIGCKKDVKSSEKEE